MSGDPNFSPPSNRRSLARLLLLRVVSVSMAHPLCYKTARICLQKLQPLSDSPAFFFVDLHPRGFHFSFITRSPSR